MEKSTFSDVVPSSSNFGISDEMTKLLQVIIYGGICQAISIFGIITNVINIICFVKQGFKDTVNISLLGLSISDLGCLVTLFCTNVCFLIPVMVPTDLSFEPLDIIYMIFFIPHMAFARVSSWITAVITLDRCLCIVIPLKVKRIFTNTRMTTIIIFTFPILFASGMPIYAVNRLGLKFLPVKNKTTYGIVFLEGRDTVDSISFIVNSFLIPFTAFGIIVVCTVILVVKLSKINKWRKSSSQGTTDVTRRNQKVAKMVVLISTLFIACFIPLSILMLAIAFQRDLAMEGKHVNISVLLGSLGLGLESINASVNIFIYYTMSSKYKETFHCVWFGPRNELKISYSN